MGTNFFLCFLVIGVLYEIVIEPQNKNTCTLEKQAARNFLAVTLHGNLV